MSKVEGSPLMDVVMPPKAGLAVELMRGQHMRITHLEGKHARDLTGFIEVFAPR